MRSKKWTDKRKLYPVWRFYLRLLPQLVPVEGNCWLFFVVPSLKDNRSTIIDAFGLFPAAMIFLVIVFLVGVVLIITRAYY